MSKFFSQAPASKKSALIKIQFDFSGRYASAQGSIAPSGIIYVQMNKGLRQIPDNGGQVSAVEVISSGAAPAGRRERTVGSAELTNRLEGRHPFCDAIRFPCDHG
jgi:hypothetical protein